MNIVSIFPIANTFPFNFIVSICCVYSSARNDIPAVCGCNLDPRLKARPHYTQGFSILYWQLTGAVSYVCWEIYSGSLGLLRARCQLVDHFYHDCTCVLSYIAIYSVFVLFFVFSPFLYLDAEWFNFSVLFICFAHAFVSFYYYF